MTPTPGPRAHIETRVAKIAARLAALTAASYLLIGAGVLGTGDLTAKEAPAAVAYAAAAAYLVGAGLILLRRRRLWVTGTVLNGMVLLFFFAGYAERPAVLTSAGGVLSKVTQVLLEIALIYLVRSSRPGSPDRAGDRSLVDAR